MSGNIRPQRRRVYLHRLQPPSDEAAPCRGRRHSDERNMQNKETDMDIQESKEKIQSLYDELKKEVDGIYTPTGAFLPPSSGVYYINEEEVRNYSMLDSSAELILEYLLHTLGKEVSYVFNYDGKRKSQKKQREELEALMRKATHQIYIDLCPLIEDK